MFRFIKHMFLTAIAFFSCNALKCVLINNQEIFFSIWVFLHEHSRITGLQGRGEGISLTPRYHFPPASQILRHEPGDYRTELTSAHSQQPDSNRQSLVFEGKSLTTKLRALKNRNDKYYLCSYNNINDPYTKLCVLDVVKNKY